MDYPSDGAKVKQSNFIISKTDSEEFKNAINVGFWSSDFPMSPVCPPKNCTWLPFQSVEVCSKCEDVTSSARLSGCTDAPFNADLLEPQPKACNVTLLQGGLSPYPIKIETQGRQDNISYFSMEIPEHMIWGVDWMENSVRIKNPDQGLTAAQEVDNLVIPDNSYIGVENPLMVVAHAALDIPKANRSDIQSHPERGLKIRHVTQCVLSLCPRTYNLTVARGLPTADIARLDWGRFFTRKYNISDWITGGICWKASDVGSVNVDTTSRYTNANKSAFCPALQLSNSHLGDALRDEAIREFHYDTWHQRWYDRTDSSLPSSVTIEKIIHIGLERAMGNIAASLTKYARDTSNNFITGTMTVSESYVAVKWAWLTLPAVLLVMGIAFLVSTALLNTKTELGLWKSSVLPVLYHGIEGDLVPDGERVNSVTEMERNAKRVGVRLEYSDERGRVMLRR